MALKDAVSYRFCLDVQSYFSDFIKVLAFCPLTALSGLRFWQCLPLKNTSEPQRVQLTQTLNSFKEKHHEPEQETNTSRLYR